MKDIEKAKFLLTGSNYTCVLCRGDETLTSSKPGISPMLDFIGSGKNLVGFSAADKVVGKAAALLFVLSGIVEVWADVMSDGAAAVLDAHKIKYDFAARTTHIENRRGDDICPMEKTVAEIDDPREAHAALVAKLEELRDNSSN